MTADPTSRPTRVRLIIVLLTTLVAVLLYLDRICLGFAELFVREELALTRGQMGLVLGSFFLAYAIGQVPAGWLGDRYGARVMLTIYLVGWSLCTGLMGFAYGLGTLLLLRLGCGLFQAGAYPTGASLIRRWVPLERRGLASGVVAVGGRLGGAVAPPLTAFLMVALIPADQSPLLTPEDILPGREVHFVRALGDPGAVKTEKSNAAPLTPEEQKKEEARQEILKRIAGGLPGSDQALTRALAAAAKAEEEKGAADRVQSIPVDQETLRRVLAGVNASLARADLLEGLDTTLLNLPGEARDYLAQDSQTLTTAEVQRRNRLVLEAVLPEVVRKFYGPGWRPTLLLYGVAGILVALLFWWAFRDSPRQHPGVNPAELALIEADQPKADPGPEKASTGPGPPPLPWKALLTNRSLWLMSAVQFLTNLSWAFLITWFPTYLAQEHLVPVEERGLMTFLPLFVGIGGMLAGGWVTDWAARKWGVRLGRVLPISGSRFVAGGAFLACLFLNSPWPITLAMILVALFTDLGTPAMWAYSLDVGGKNTGAVLGWGNMWGNFGAFVSPMLLGALSPGPLFLVCGLGFVLSGVLALGIDATQRIALGP